MDPVKKKYPFHIILSLMDQQKLLMLLNLNIWIYILAAMKQNGK